MANPSKNLTHNTRLRLTEFERAQVDDLADYYGAGTKPVSFNDAVRTAINTTWQQLPSKHRTAQLTPTVDDRQTTITMETTE